MANLAKLHGHSMAGGVIGGEPLCVVVIVAIKRLVYVGGAIMREGKNFVGILTQTLQVDH